ncbi:MAG: glucosamine-6-phosphate deaminase [Ectobacillus sp.]
MKIIKVKDYEEMSQRAAEIVIQKVKGSAHFNLGLATGGTPKGLYEKMIADHQQNGTSYQHVTTFNLDEYAGLGKDDPNSYHYYMDTALFGHIDIPKSQTHLPDGMAVDYMKECERYEQLMEAVGGIDLQILGIGRNGHIGFNEPGTSFQSSTHVVGLQESTRIANARYFQAMDDVPTHAITMGIATIMKSKEIVLLVSGEEKAAALQRLLYGEVSEDFPASVLKRHQHVIIIADEKALR